MDLDDMSTMEKIRVIRQNPLLAKSRKRYWSEAEERKLETLYYDGVGLSKIAVTMGRSESSVINRLSKLRRQNRRKK